ncbi:MmgE/PrpD family protein [Nitratireductor aquimarinus]|uniref:MmgE/PrpD family protein n=1 Tax=Nitratireductor TaxID=245876 RepID=UPI0019D39A99|nr:MmgE/PrpD family protein [Nitratireductor aquimarinus]MBN7776558.1 MmgE/PrpD family protein [Nitratireductor pacificus]MBN7779425.1 MmgE/PrpD family protein [Nitratireductor pacificus]MBN7788232.1 MmgE/PrpD family protein [Nitratireductor aquimarinus]MBY6098279.1 MmgE/PrpD family protein [Nitratireductor aquimarinus]MCA1259258.1 MmgE/PrpD family protein [Nitratireductor aquimarinus]
MTETLLEKIAARAAGTAPVTAANRQAAQRAIADTLACMVAGQDDMATSSVRQAVVTRHMPGPAALVGGGTAAPSTAALVNGTAAHALDFDDNFTPGMSHASAVLVPALLALGQSVQASGAQLVDAYLIGLEAQALVGRGVVPEHYVAGWHGTSTVGTIGTAAGCAALLGHDRSGLVQAMSLAVSMASGTKGQFGTPAKPFHAGMAARNAVEAALLAGAGLFGRSDILERAQGFGDLMSGGQEADWNLPENGAPHVIETDGLMPKIHPCCGSTHNSVDMVLALRHKHGFAPMDVVEIVLTVGRANYSNLAYPEPVTPMEARFSMQYCVALALTQDGLSLSDFTPTAVGRSHLRALFDRISMRVMPLDKEAGAKRPPHHALIRLADGRELTAELANARGSLSAPLDETTRVAKLRDCFDYAGVTLDMRGLALLEGIDELPNLSGLAALIGTQAEQPAKIG